MKADHLSTVLTRVTSTPRYRALAKPHLIKIAASIVAGQAEIIHRELRQCDKEDEEKLKSLIYLALQKSNEVLNIDATLLFRSNPKRR